MGQLFITSGLFFQIGEAVDLREEEVRLVVLAVPDLARQEAILAAAAPAGGSVLDDTVLAGVVVHVGFDHLLPSTDTRSGAFRREEFVVFGKHMQIVENERIPMDGSYSYAMIDGKMAVMIPDLKKNSQRLQEIIYGTTATADSSTSGQGN